MPNQAGNTRRDFFVERLLAAAAFGVALLAAGYAGYFTFLGIPAVRAVHADFGLSLCGLIRVPLDCPWIPGVFACVALVAGAVAWVRPSRRPLVCAFAVTYAAVALTLAFELAARWPMNVLAQSITPAAP